MNKNIKRLSEPNARMYLIFLALFAAASLYFGQYYLAIAEAGIIVILAIYAAIVRRKKTKQLEEFVESVTYNTENAKDSTLLNFPLPIAVFTLEDSNIVWANEHFFKMTGNTGRRTDVHISDLMPGFSGKWLMEGKNIYPELVTIEGKKYQVHGNIIRSDENHPDTAFMGITYWVDMTAYDDIKVKYENSLPVVFEIVADNYAEMANNQPDRIRNDIRDAIEDKLRAFAQENEGIVKRTERDRYIFILQNKAYEKVKEEKFRILEDVKSVTNPAGITASLSIGVGVGGDSLEELSNLANTAAELALSRGGDQAVIKNKLNFEFFGGRGDEVEKRTKVRTRVIANTYANLIKDSSKVFVMGHSFGDLDSLGACVAVYVIARKFGVPAHIIFDKKNTSCPEMAEMLLSHEEYKSVFISNQEAMLRSDAKTLLTVVDTNRPEKVENEDMLFSCSRIAVIDHHRAAATSIKNAALALVEPYASSACELLTEIMQELIEKEDIEPFEADAVLAGIVLDTKNFTLRTGERTFDAAAYLRRSGADTLEVRKFLKSDMEDSKAKYRILQNASLYRGIALAAPEEEVARVTAAKAADELLNISGVETSVVLYKQDRKSPVCASARSTGDINVQLIMEALGGGGNKGVAAVEFEEGVTVPQALDKVKTAIDNYFDQ